MKSDLISRYNATQQAITSNLEEIENIVSSIEEIKNQIGDSGTQTVRKELEQLDKSAQRLVQKTSTLFEVHKQFAQEEVHQHPYDTVKGKYFLNNLLFWGWITVFSLCMYSRTADFTIPIFDFAWVLFIYVLPVATVGQLDQIRRLAKHSQQVDTTSLSHPNNE